MKAVRGMHDLFGIELSQWQSVEKTIRGVLEGFGYKEIRTPVLENAEVFTKTVGDDTDIVEKQMYQINKESETLVLRPEGTASFMRAITEHQLTQQTQQRFYYYLPMFRHERPQKGRLRQFHQFGAEFINDPSPHADAELIVLLDSIYKKFDISEYKIEINSVGCSECRPAYRETLKRFFKPFLVQLCAQCQKRFERAPMRILDCKSEACQNVAISAPLITESLCTLCQSHHQGLKACLSQAKLGYFENPRIVRGLDYYSRTAFEFTSELLGAQSALGGGGRYDCLAERFSHKPFPAVGFALGMERLMIALAAKNKLPVITEAPLFYLAALGKPALDLLYPIALNLCRKERWCELPYETDRSLKSHLKNANRLGAKYAIIVGENEMTSNKALVKEMSSHQQFEVSLSDLENELLRRN